MNLEVYPTDDIENVSANRGEYKNINNPNDVLAQKLGPDFSIDLRFKYASLNCEIKH